MEELLDFLIGAGCGVLLLYLAALLWGSENMPSGMRREILGVVLGASALTGAAVYMETKPRPSPSSSYDAQKKPALGEKAAPKDLQDMEHRFLPLFYLSGGKAVA